MNYPSRQQSIRAVLPSHGLDALLVTHLPNVRYLCGFTGSAGVLLVRREESIFFTDGRYTQQAKAEVRATKVVIAKKSPLLAAAEALKRKRLTSARKFALGIEASYLTVSARSTLLEALPGHTRLRETVGLVERARTVKDAEEIALIRQAVTHGAALFDRALKIIRPGVQEIEVAAEMEYAARKSGAEGMSFETIIASGPRSALPHGRASTAAIASEGFVVCDFGVILRGYCSDRTRTVYVGAANAEARRVYDAVLAAQQEAMDAVRPGIQVGQVDRAARKILQKNGLAKYFTHSTGHGVGLEIHEAPRLAKGQEEVLRPGMVITIEPGVYLPGKWGVRIEDMVVVTENGCEALTPTQKEFISI